MSDLYIKEGTQEIGSGETLAYSVTTTPWATSPTAGTIKIYDRTTGYTDVTSTLCSGGASESGNTVTFTLTGATAKHTFQLICPFTSGSNTWTIVGDWYCPV